MAWRENNMKVVIVFIALLGCLASKPEIRNVAIDLENIKVTSCYECYWDYYDQDYTDCLWYYCRSEVINKEVLFKEKALDLTSCLDCESLYPHYNYFSCVYENCQEKIRETAKLVAINTPNVLVQRIPMKTYSTCADCYIDYYGYFYDCVYYYCRSEVIDKEVLMSSATLSKSCSSCSNYSGTNYNNCVYFFCKHEIESKINSLYADLAKKEISLGYCQDNCYWEYFYNNYDYTSCVDYYCKGENSNKAELYYSRGLVNKNGEKLMSDCDLCYYYYEGDEFDECFAYFCNSESTYTKKSLISTRPEIKMPGCDSCYEYDDNFDCILIYCKSEILDKSIEAVDKTVKLTPCTDSCYYDYIYYGENYYNCVEDYCKSEVQNYYKLYIAKNKKIMNAEKKNKLEECSFCYSEEDSYSCFWNTCRSQIIDKEVLFADVSEESKLMDCYDCYFAENDSYYDCVFFQCKQEILDKAKLVAIKSPELIRSDLKIHRGDSQACSSCGNYDESYGAFYEYECITTYCKSEITEKKTLFSIVPSTDLSDCETCFYVDGEEYFNCVYFYCMSEITAKFTGLYPQSEPIMTETCDEYCYLEWYYYNVDYYVCYENFCNMTSNDGIVFSKVPELFKQKGEIQLDCETDCFSAYLDNSDYFYNCIWDNCKHLYSDGLKSEIPVDIELNKADIKLDYCDDCLTWYEIYYYDYEEYYDCVYWYCKEKILDQVKVLEKQKSQYTVNQEKNLLMAAGGEIEGDIEQVCYYYYYESVYGYDYYYCYVYYSKYQEFKEVKLETLETGEKSWVTCSAIGVIALVFGIFVYIKYSKKKLVWKVDNCGSETPYKLII